MNTADWINIFLVIVGFIVTGLGAWNARLQLSISNIKDQVSKNATKIAVNSAGDATVLTNISDINAKLDRFETAIGNLTTEVAKLQTRLDHG